MQEKAGDVAQIQAPEAADRCIRRKSIAQRALRVVEIELFDNRTVQYDQSVAARRVAAMLDAVQRVAHGFDQRHQHRHILGSTSGHHTIYSDIPYRRRALIGQQHAQHFIGRPIGEAQERSDFLARRRHNRQTI